MRRSKESWLFEFEDLILEVNNNVYEPAEDSFLLAKYVKTAKGKILDLGCGCGLVGLLNKKHNPENEVWCCDINEKAVILVEKNAKMNGLDVRCVKTDLFSSLPQHYFDCIAFNPPYLPKENEISLKEEDKLAFHGKIGGDEIIQRFLSQSLDYLTKRGQIFLILSSLNNTEKVCEIIKKQNMHHSMLEKECFFFENIELWLIERELKDTHKNILLHK